MEKTSDLGYIKKHYGENLARLCRKLFPSLLETPGLLKSTISSIFEPNKCLYNDIITENAENNFKKLVLSRVKANNTKKAQSNKTPFEIMELAGYTLYECKTYDEVKKFEKYYYPFEVLCTFKEIEDRLKKCHIFFAVKNNAEKLNREHFDNPQREDEYGASVLSLQFDRGDVNTLSIKNRYNNHAQNCDATFGNNLENIYPGLTNSFVKAYGFNLYSLTDYEFLDGSNKYVLDKNRKYYKLNVQKDNLCFCGNNVLLKDGNPIVFDKCKYELIDDFLLDKHNKQIRCVTSSGKTVDFLPKMLCNISKIDIVSAPNGHRKLIIENSHGTTEIVINQNNSIVSLKNDYVTEIGNNFLRNCKNISHIELPQVESVGDNFLMASESCPKVEFANLKKVGNNFLINNQDATSIVMPNLMQVEDNFMLLNNKATTVECPKLSQIGDMFLAHNACLENLSLPSLINVGDGFLCLNQMLKNANLPNLSTAGNSFLKHNLCLQKIDLPKLKHMGYGSLCANKKIDNLWWVPYCAKQKNFNTWER